MAMEKLLGGQVMGKDGMVDVSPLDDKDLVGLYFSAHWCPPCRSFTPVLVDRYNKIEKLDKKIGIVFVSSDRDEASFSEYYNEMPWLALPYSDRERKENLSDKYKVQGIPTLVFVNPKTGQTVTTNGREKITADKDGEMFPDYQD